jgi:hypothetical protein
MQGITDEEIHKLRTLNPVGMQYGCTQGVVDVVNRLLNHYCELTGRKNAPKPLPPDLLDFDDDARLQRSKNVRAAT